MTTIDDMSEHERLAAYLSGDLDAAERAEVEAALEERPELRARLDAVREVDDALAALPRATPRDGFSERLEGVVDDALREQLGDELAARRRERTLPRWALPAAAALVALVVGAGVAIQLVGGSDPGGGLEAVTDTLDGGAAGRGPGTGTVPEELPVASTGRDYDEEEARDLLGDRRFGALAGLRVGEDEARTLTEDLVEGLPAPAPEPEGLVMPEEEAPARPGGRRADPDGETTDDGSAREDAPTRGGAVTGGVGAVSRCLPRLLGSTSGPVVPAFAEVASFRGEPAVIYGLLRPGPDDPALTDREIWILDRATCTVRYFAPAPSG